MIESKRRRNRGKRSVAKKIPDNIKTIEKVFGDALERKRKIENAAEGSQF